MIKIFLISLLFVTTHVVAGDKPSEKTEKTHESSKSKEKHESNEKHDKVADYLEEQREHKPVSPH